MGADDRIRSVIVRVHSRGTRSILLKRSLQCLYLLEVKCHLDDNDKDVPDQDNETEKLKEPPPRRGQRSARDSMKAYNYDSLSELTVTVSTLLTSLTSGQHGGVLYYVILK